MFPTLLQGISLTIAPTLPARDFALSVSPSAFPPALLPAVASFTLGTPSTTGGKKNYPAIVLIPLSGELPPYQLLPIHQPTYLAEPGFWCGIVTTC